MTVTVDHATAATAIDPPLSLSMRLRTGTREIHGETEGTDFITQLMAGELDRSAFVDFMAQHHPIYLALEAASEAQRRDPRGKALVFDELTRTPSLERDLEFLLGSNWAEQVEILPETIAYADHLRAIGPDLGRYAAHAYTRYLGDLSGGQVIKRMMQRHYGFTDDGLSFYTFTDIPKAKPFKDVYRERLDGLTLTESEIDDTVDEALTAFRLNKAIFEGLSARHCH